MIFSKLFVIVVDGYKKIGFFVAKNRISDKLGIISVLIFRFSGIKINYETEWHWLAWNFFGNDIPNHAVTDLLDGYHGN